MLRTSWSVEIKFPSKIKKKFGNYITFVFFLTRLDKKAQKFRAYPITVALPDSNGIL